MTWNRTVHGSPSSVVSIGLLTSALACAGCSGDDPGTPPSAPAAKLPRDALPDGLYHDFLDGKYDGAGHPLDAEVWQAEDGCNAEVGVREAEGRAFSPASHAAGTACSATSKSIGLGHFTLNLRALVYQTCDAASCDPQAPVFTVTVRSPGGTPIETRTVRYQEFSEALVYENLALKFTHGEDGPVGFEVRWEDQVAVRVDYVELFRSSRSLLITPPSGVLSPSATFQIEAQDPPQGFELAVRCDELDRTAALTALLASGEATREDTEFRAAFSIPAAKLLQGCPLPTRVRVSVVTGTWVRATSRVTVFAEEAPCTFVAGTRRVLLTGFEPFPADSTSDNTSEQAVQSFDPVAVPGISLMRLTLPVEFDTAAELLGSAITRCNPDLVVGFGQGRSEVDLETTAYNRKDSSDFGDGFPDNRGLVTGGEPIAPGGPAERSTKLPTDVIRSSLQAAGIATNFSDDPGRYVCNNLFYRIMTETEGTPRLGGFVHLPRIASVDDADRAMLKTVVTTVVDRSVAALAGE